jgi:hypothetical protein
MTRTHDVMTRTHDVILTSAATGPLLADTRPQGNSQPLLRLLTRLLDE